MAINNIPIGDNTIYMQKKGSTAAKDTVTTILLGAERIDVGIDSGTREIATDKESGYKYARNAIEGKQIYNLRTQKQGCFFALDLETGKRGWYPGAIQIADITGTNVDIKAEKSDTSATVITVSGVTVKILEFEYDDSKAIWCKVDYNLNVGYVREALISNVRYSDPY